MRQVNFIVSILFLFLLSQAAPVHAGRPLNTDDAGTVEPGVLEIETAFEHVDAPDNENNLSAVFTTGLLEKLDIGVEIPYQFVDFDGAEDEEGLSDIAITTKWNFLNREDLFDATLSFNYKTESGEVDKGLGSDEPEYTVLLIASKEIDGLTYHINLGPTIVPESNDVFNYNFAIEWDVSDRMNLVGEFYGNTMFEGRFDDNAMSGLIGLTYQLNENVVYDLGTAFGISDADPDFSVTTGLTVALGGP